MTRAAFAIAAIFLAAAPAGAQRFGPPQPDSYTPAGYEVFLGVLHVHGFTPPPAATIRTTPDVLIVFNPGHPPVDDRFMPEPTARLLGQKVLNKGGSVLLAADGEFADLTDYFPGGTTPVSSSAKSAVTPGPQVWAENRRCPLAVPVPPGFGEMFNGIRGQETDPVRELFGGRFRIATNAPSTLNIPFAGNYLPHTLARLPRGTTDTTGRKFPDLTLAVGGDGPPRGGERRARSLVVADPGVFSNQMLTAVDKGGRPSDNLALSDAVAVWLANGRPNPTCLVLVGNHPRMDFGDVDLNTPPPLPPPPAIPPLPLPSLNPFDPATVKLDQALTGAAEDAVATLESAGGGLDRLVGANDETGAKFARIGRSALAAVAVAAALLTLRRVWRARHRPAADDDAPVPVPTPAAEQADPTGPVRDYVCDLLRLAGAADFSGGMPALVGPRAKTFRAGVRILWDIAGGRDGRPVTAARWRELAPHVQAAQDGLAAGAWRFRT